MEPTTIELSRPEAGGPDPKQLLIDLLINTPLTINDFTLISKELGNYRWQLAENKALAYMRALPKIRKRIRALYAKGLISYGSW